MEGVVRPRLFSALGASAVIVDQPGAGGTIGTVTSTAAQPSGCTLKHATVDPLVSRRHLLWLSDGPGSSD